MSLVDIFGLRSRVAVVTGGYGHLGSAISEYLAEAGATVVVAARSPAKFEAFANRDRAHTYDFAQCDVANADSVDAAIASVAQKHGGLDILVNNAYYGAAGGRPEAMSDHDFMLGLDGSLGTVYRCIRSSIPFLRERHGASIVNVSSMYGVVAPDFRAYANAPQFTNPANYGAGKAGLLQLTRYFASLLGPLDIRVNAVTPGPFPSPDIQQNEDFIAQLRERTTLGRIGQPRDVAGAVLFAAGPASAFMTGQNIIVDGGWTAR